MAPVVFSQNDQIPRLSAIEKGSKCNRQWPSERPIPLLTSTTYGSENTRLPPGTDLIHPRLEFRKAQLRATDKPGWQIPSIARRLEARLRAPQTSIFTFTARIAIEPLKVRPTQGPEMSKCNSLGAHRARKPRTSANRSYVGNTID